jgi:tripartite-type tricarboxylate transporter receptor subunit TctC
MPSKFYGVVVAALMLAALPSTNSTAQTPSDYPNRTIRFIVPYSPGGFPDTVARIAGLWLQEKWKQSVVIENRPGGNGSVAAAALAAAPADGYTFMVSDGSILSVNRMFFRNLSYNPDTDFVPVALLARAAIFLASHPKVPVSTFHEFVDYVRAHPGKINYGSAGVGSTHHLTMEALKAELKLQMNHIPFKGSGQSVPALLGGHVDVLFAAYPALSGALEGKQVKVLATNAPVRSAFAPEIPPIADTIPGFDFSSLAGILAKTGTPRSIIDKVAAEASEAMRLVESQKQLAAAGVEPIGEGADSYARAIKAENDRVAQAALRAGIRPE